jgi:hypothetical protein
MKFWQYFSLLVLVVLLGSAGFYMILVLNQAGKIVQAKEIEVKVQVADFIGFDVNSSLLTFGAMTPGQKGMRNITIESNISRPVVAHFEKEGIAEWITGYEEGYVLQPYEKKSMRLNLEVPPGTEHGNYTGKFYVFLIE